MILAASVTTSYWSGGSVTAETAVVPPAVVVVRASGGQEMVGGNGCGPLSGEDAGRRAYPRSAPASTVLSADVRTEPSMPTDPYEYIGARIASYRKLAGYTQQELAEHAHLSLGGIRKVERGERLPIPPNGPGDGPGARLPVPPRRPGAACAGGVDGVCLPVNLNDCQKVPQCGVFQGSSSEHTRSAPPVRTATGLL